MIPGWKNLAAPRRRLPGTRRAPGRGAAVACMLAALAMGACAGSQSGPAVVWTDTPETLVAAELFNASQSRHLVEVRWKDDLPAALASGEHPPSLVVGRRLRSRTVMVGFQELDYLFSEFVINPRAFYPALLKAGAPGGRQVLVPVSFNLPLVAFAASAPVSRDLASLNMDIMAPLAGLHNSMKDGQFERMGFSPRWDKGFLADWVSAAGAGFTEAPAARKGGGAQAAPTPLYWDADGLEKAVERLRQWSSTVNGSAALEDEFQFKYLYAPGYRYAAAGRTLFTVMDSAGFFTLGGDKRAALDYRWFSQGSTLPAGDDAVFLGMPRAGGGKDAAELFIKWLFREENQRAMLERAAGTQALGYSFGLMGGFSSMAEVNEKAFPAYYPALAGRLPRKDSVAAPPPRPSAWPRLKAEVVGPWLFETAALPPGTGGASEGLSALIEAYLRRNPELD